MLAISASQRINLQDAQIILQIEAVRAEQQRYSYRTYVLVPQKKSMDSFSLEGDLACAVERRDVRVKLCSSHARRIEPTLERSILAEWATRLAAHPRMFNGRKFRFGRVAARESGEKGAAFELGLTDYRSMVGTNMSSRWREIEAKDPTLLANPVGNAAVVETADGCVLLLKRSTSLLEAPGMWVFPGGHAEPKDAGIDAWGDGEVAAHEAAREVARAAGDDGEDDVERRVGDELFASIRREVVEEIGVRDEDLCVTGDPPHVFIGVSRRTQGCRYTTAFVMSGARSSSEILARYATPGCAVDAYESSGIIAVPIAELATRAASLEMPGCHRGVLELYMRYRAAHR